MKTPAKAGAESRDLGSTFLCMMAKGKANAVERAAEVRRQLVQLLRAAASHTMAYMQTSTQPLGQSVRDGIWSRFEFICAYEVEESEEV